VLPVTDLIDVTRLPCVGQARPARADSLLQQRLSLDALITVLGRLPHLLPDFVVDVIYLFFEGVDCSRARIDLLVYQSEGVIKEQ